MSRPMPPSEHPEWPRYKDFVYDPYYISMFRERPQEAAREYRELLQSEDAKIISFMLAFPYNGSTPQQIQSLWISRFPVALLDSLADDKWYESFRDMAADADFGQVTTAESVRSCFPSKFRADRTTLEYASCCLRWRFAAYFLL